MKTILAVLMLVAAPMFAQTEYQESPYAGELLGNAAEGQDHFVIIEHKCGAGCQDCALLFISYSRVKMLSPSLFNKVWPKIHLKEYHHAGVYFDKWDIDNGKLYLKAYANNTSPTKGFSYEWRVAYDLRSNTFTVGPRTNFSPTSD
jgi:hypothetical protein